MSYFLGLHLKPFMEKEIKIKNYKPFSLSCDPLRAHLLEVWNVALLAVTCLVSCTKPERRASFYLSRRHSSVKGRCCIHSSVVCYIYSVSVTRCWSNLQTGGGERSAALLKRCFLGDVEFEGGLIWCPVYIAEGTSGKGTSMGKDREKDKEAQK